MASLRRASSPSLGMPAADFSRTTLYEVTGADGRFEASIDVTGELLVLLTFRER
jgi:hypothetical protein